MRRLGTLDQHQPRHGAYGCQHKQRPVDVFDVERRRKCAEQESDYKQNKTDCFH